MRIKLLQFICYDSPLDRFKGFSSPLFKNPISVLCLDDDVFAAFSMLNVKNLAVYLFFINALDAELPLIKPPKTCVVS